MIPLTVVQNETDFSSGQPVSKSVIVSVDPLKQLDGLKVGDFALSVLLASGSTDLLQPTKPISPSPLNIADAADSVVNNFDPSSIVEPKITE